MASKVFLNLNAGNLAIGYNSVSCRLVRDGQDISQDKGGLPANPILQSLSQQWQLGYASHYESQNYELRGAHPEFEIDDTGTTGYSQADFRQVCADLELCIKQWLGHPDFRSIADMLRLNLNPNETVVIVIETEDRVIHGLPWHHWDLLDDLPQAEIAFCLSQQQTKLTRSQHQKPRILAIFGDGQDLDLQPEALGLGGLNAELLPLKQPTAQQLAQHLQNPQGWDLLFFAGHSGNEAIPHLSAEPQGAIRLNGQDTIALAELKNSLRQAINFGLQVAIFNSCSGLGLATSLADLHIPTTIVMREAVPDRVAQEFLRGFLTSFTRGQPLLCAVRAARQQLERLERDFPCATWLPVVFCNPLVDPPHWQHWYAKAKIPWGQILAVAAVVTGVLWGLRSQGSFEPWELQAYDLAINQRWFPEAPDPRLVIVGVTGEDFNYLGQRGWADKEILSDGVVVKLLQKLQSYSPKAIGLDIYRSNPLGTTAEQSRDHQQLLKLLKQENMIATCLMAGENGSSQEFPGEAAPSGVPKNQVGFTNFVTDRDVIDRDRKVRRQLLGMAPVNADCPSDHALSLRLALRFLGEPEAAETKTGNLRIGKKELAVLPTALGAYRSTAAQENLQGFQVLLNYRHATPVAAQVTLADVLENRVGSNFFKDKIVLVGYLACRKDDFFSTAYAGQTPCPNNRQMSGVEIHAHMTSNLLSHILDGRALLWTWPDGLEGLWIGSWGVVGGLIFLYLRPHSLPSSWILVVGMGAVLLFIYGLGFNLWSLWLPLIPAELALFCTPMTLLAIHQGQRYMHKKLSASRREQS